MYNAPREVQESVYDYFATRLTNSELRPSPDAYQAIRLKVAEASQTNPMLAKALAATAGVSEQTDWYRPQSCRGGGNARPNCLRR